MTEERRQQIIKIVRDQIIWAIKDDLKHSESLMKEAFEKMVSEEDFEVCYAEMRYIIKHIEKLAL